MPFKVLHLILLLPLAACVSENGAATDSRFGGNERSDSCEVPRAIDKTVAAALDLKIDAAAAEGFAGQVAILKDGALIYSRAAGSADLACDVPVTEETLYHVASLTKYFTAILILKAVEEEKLSLDATAAGLFPGTALADRDFTLEDLLAHRAGFKSTYAAESETTPDGAIEAIAKANPDLLPSPACGRGAGGEGMQCADGAPSPESGKALTPAPSPASGRGERPFKYSNDGYDLLAIVLERTYGKPYEAILREKIAEPACLDHIAFWGEPARDDPRRRGQPLSPPSEQLGRRNYGMIGSAGLLISAENLVRFERALNEGAILSPSALAELRKPRGAASIGEVLYGSFRIRSDNLGEAVSARGAEDWGDNAYLNDYTACGFIVAITTSRGPPMDGEAPLWRDRLIGEAEGSWRESAGVSPLKYSLILYNPVFD